MLHMEMITVEKLQGCVLGSEEKRWRMNAVSEKRILIVWRGSEKADCQTLFHSFLIYPLLRAPFTGERPSKWKRMGSWRMLTGTPHTFKHKDNKFNSLENS